MTPAGTSNELDVQNGWEENTHTHTAKRRFIHMIVLVLLYVYVEQQNNYTINEGNGRLNSSREKNQGKHRRRKVDEKTCVAPAGTSNNPDVQNKWEENTHNTHTHTHRMTRMTRPDCAVMCNLINTHTHTHSSKICTSRESVSPLSRLIRGFRNKYH